MAQHPELTEAIELAQSFAQLAMPAPARTTALVRAAQKSQLPFQRFAKRLREDHDAVKAGTLPLSNGQT